MMRVDIIKVNYILDLVKKQIVFQQALEEVVKIYEINAHPVMENVLRLEVMVQYTV